jgi:Fe-S-cluster containining protein
VEHLAAVGRPAREAEDFKAYVSKTKKEASDDLLHEVCPFHAGASGCNIYPARPLSCRAFGRFINKSLLHIIPESCPLRETIVIYTDETFADLVPFALPFYSLVGRYDRFLKES